MTTPPATSRDGRRGYVVVVIDHRISATPISITAALVTACARFFGSVAAARKAAKLVPLTEKWDEARVIRLLREREANGTELPGHTYDYAQKFFGSFDAACQAAGVPMRRRAHQP